MTENDVLAVCYILGALLIIFFFTFMHGGLVDIQWMQICTYCYKCDYNCNITGEYFLECKDLNKTFCWEEMTTL